MPVAIVYTGPDVIPGVFTDDDPEALRKVITGLPAAPNLPDVVSARLWLAGLPEPSGWFETAAEAFAHTERLKAQARATASEVVAARDNLGLSRAAFADRIGIGGNDNTRHKFIFEVEKGKKELSVAATRAMRALLAEDALKDAAETNN